MTTPTKLFEPYKLGPLALPNRLVMAPLTRNRAIPPGMVPSPLAVEYYGQRASAGLLVSEATQVSQQGQGYQDTPGIYSREQVAGWRKITDRVHERGGRIFLQAWHVGRISHVNLQPNNQAPVAPSAIRAKGKTYVDGTFAEVSSAVPRTRWKPASTASKFTAPTAICWSSSPRTAPTSAPTPMAARSRTAPG